MRRIPALILTIAALVAAVVVGRDAPDTDAPVFAGEPATWMPAVSQGRGAVNWYCPGVPADGEGRGGQVVIVNTTGDELTGAYSVLTDEGQAVDEQLELQPYERVEIDVDEAVDSPFASVVVELAVNGAIVEQRAIDPDGDYVAPCATQTSDEWYLADGYTLDGSVEELIVTNPYESDAVASLALVTADGRLTPAAFQAFPVEARSVVAIDVAELGVQDEPVAAVTLTTSRGQVVLGRSQRFDGADRGGLTMTLAAPALAGQWWFVAGESGEGVSEEYRIYNPTNDDVEITASALGVEPTEDAPLAGTVDVDAEAGRVTTFRPEDVEGLREGPHSFVFSTVDLPGVVIERVFSRTSNLGTATSVSLGGLARPDGFIANNWFVGTSPQGATEDALVIYNAVTSDATVSVRAVTDGGFVEILGLQEAAVPANSTVTIDLAEQRALGRTLLVSSTQPVLVERQIPRDGPLGGVTTAWAIPLDA